MKRILLGSTITAIVCISALQVAAQSSYYDSRARQNAEYRSLSNATNRAYSVPDRPAAAPSSARPASSGSITGSNRPAGVSTSSNSGSASTSTPPARVEKTNAEITAEHNTWLRKVRAEEAAESKARADTRTAERTVAEQQRNAFASEKARAPEVLAEAAKIEAAGFTSTEAFYIAHRMVPQANGVAVVSGQELKYLQEARLARKRFTERRPAAGYDELRELVNLFMTATITAMNAYQSIAARFPEKSVETELLEIGCIPFIWGGTQTWNTWLQADRATDGEKREVLDRYRELAAKYPEKAKAMRESMNSNAGTRFEAALAAVK